MTQGSITNRRTPNKVIVCRCPECRGRQWSLTEIRHANGAAGGNPDQVVNGLTLSKIARLIDHPLRYLDTTPAGAWKQSAPVNRHEGERTPWRFGSDPDVMENTLPVNPGFIPCSDATAADPPREGT